MQGFDRSATIAFAAALFAVSDGAGAAGMNVTSGAFAEGGTIPALHAADGDCGGQNVSPQVSWSGAPAGTKSVAVLMTDPDGSKGLEVVHWVAYGIASERGELRQGEGEKDDVGLVVGTNSAGTVRYRGMCPPPGDTPHHYVLTIVATDLAPTALPAALGRDALLDALKGHALEAQSVVGRYGR